MIRRTIPCLLLLCALWVMICSPALAAGSTDQTTPTTEPLIEDTQQIPARQSELQISGYGYEDFSFLTDGDDYWYFSSDWGCKLNLQSSEPFQSLYLMFDLECGEYTITDDLTGEALTAGKYGFLHEYVPLPFSTTSVTISFPASVSLSEISAYSGGTPSNVQIWQPPLEGETELLLLSTHGDDEHLYFAGLLPYYAGEQKYNVQVAYLTDHRNMTYERTHEMLNGLWAVGVTAYPVFGSFADFRIDSLEGTYWKYAALGVSRDELLDYVVTLLRRFDPQVVVGHDFAGEYGHGMHQVYADLLSEAVLLSNDPNVFPKSAQTYGVWEVSKAYFHLYEEDPIVLDYDQPLEAFNGMTAFDVSRKIGFPCHVTQQEYVAFSQWINGDYGEITKASQIETFNPCHFGLYFTTVGSDVEKNDFMENTPSCLERKRLEAERIAKEEEARRLEAERLALEEAERKAEEAKRLEEQRLKDEAAAKAEEQRRMTICLTAIGAVVLLIVIGSVLLRMLRRRPKEAPPDPQK